MSLVAIVGRPNVGKSTLFNRLTERRASIVHDEPGVTRDRVYGDAIWNGVSFQLVDTGGFVAASDDVYERAIRGQVEIALNEADAILFIVDVTTGTADLDEDVASLLRTTDKPVFVVANKADNETLRWSAADFYSFGLGEVYPVSSINGSGTGELLDDLVATLPKQTPAAAGGGGSGGSRSETEAYAADPWDEDTDGAEAGGEGYDRADDTVRLAIIGRPNVGKSSLANALLGEERSIVSDESGTTRDTVDSTLKYHGRDVVLVDTAGLRRRSRVSEDVEFYSMLRTERALRDGDVAILMVDARTGMEAQDIKVLRQAADLNKGIVIALNKWDLVEKETNTARDVERSIRERLATLDYVPIVFVSALTRQRVQKLLEIAIEVTDRRRQRIPTSRLNEVMLAAIERRNPPSYRNRYVRIKHVLQVKTDPPVFSFFCNYPKGVQVSYQRYLEGQLRKAFDFTGVPLSLVFRQK
jgi:GTP-binding protein